MRIKGKILIVVSVLALVAAACGSSDTGAATTTRGPATTSTSLGTTTTEAPSTTEIPQTTEVAPSTEAPAAPVEEPAERSLDAPVAAITVDGDPSDWADVVGLAMTLEPIVADADKPIENRDVTIKMAHDDENIYALFTVDDDYNWNAEDAKLSSAAALLFPVDSGGPHMGADDEQGANSTGLVDVWHWELECAAGIESGGAVNPPGEGKDLGNDSVCNFDDEWASDALTRGDDNGAGAENNLLGVWNHSNPTADSPGLWYFEMSRPLQTGDEQDARFAAGESTLLALAYWDSDFGPDGWDDSTHVQSSNQGWIQVNLR